MSREGGHVEEQKERGPACRGEGLLPMEVSPRDGFLALALDAVKDSDINILENCHPKWSVFYKTTLRRP